MGSVTRGKNAGSPRYDVVVGESVVAHLSKSGMDDARGFFGVSDDSDLPGEVKCKVILKGGDGSASCAVELVGNAPSLAAALEQAKADRPERHEWSATVTIPASPTTPWASLSHDEVRERVSAMEEVGRQDIQSMGPVMRAVFVIVAVVAGLFAALCLVAVPSMLSRGSDVRPVVVMALMCGGVSLLMRSIAKTAKGSGSEPGA